jgi:hypothetical protein
LAERNPGNAPVKTTNVFTKLWIKDGARFGLGHGWEEDRVAAPLERFCGTFRLGTRNFYSAKEITTLRRAKARKS